MSPLALWGAELLNQVDSPEQAAVHYDRIARYGLPQLRLTALERSARTHSLVLKRPSEARERLVQRLRFAENDVERASLYAEVGATWRAERNLQQASTAYRTAWRLDPTQLAYGMTAAELHFGRGEYAHARSLWKRIGAAHPDMIARMHVELGRCDLAQGYAEAALTRFEQAVSTAPSDDLEAAGRLGIASALERLGNLEDALSEIDLADLPSSAYEARRTGLSERWNRSLSED